MAVIAVYSSKGGVGKTTLAVNLAWAAATLSSRRTLLWDLDAQAAATFILGHDVDGREAEAAIRREVDARRLIRPTTIERIDLLPADASLRGLDVAFRDLDKKKRLARLTEEIRRGLARPDVRERYLKIGTPPTYRGPAEFAEFAKADVASWLPIIKASGAVIE